MIDSQTILVVEDSNDDFIATMRAFKKSNVVNQVQRCITGDQALDYLFQRGEFSTPGKAPRPVIILLDLNLPGTDGRSVLRIIKEDRNLLKIPAIVLTTSSAEHDIEWCYTVGANSCVQKPIDFDKFTQKIACILEYWLNVSIPPRLPAVQVNGK